MGKKNFFIIILCLLSAFLLIFVGIFAFYYDYYKSENIFNRNINKVVEIKVSSDKESWGYATGCFIDSDGRILTNKHVVYNQSAGVNYSYVFVRLANSEEFVSATIEKVSDVHDLAIIKIDYKSKHYFKICDKLYNGEEIYTIGNPNGFGLSLTKGLVSSSNRNVIYEDQKINAIQTDFVINEGNSGGPVFNKNGKLVGIISFRLKDNKGVVISGVSFAIPVKTILEFIK